MTNNEHTDSLKELLREAAQSGALTIHPDHTDEQGALLAKLYQTAKTADCNEIPGTLEKWHQVLDDAIAYRKLKPVAGDISRDRLAEILAGDINCASCGYAHSVGEHKLKTEQPVGESDTLKRFSQWIKDNPNTPYAAMTLAVHRYFHGLWENGNNVDFGDDPYHDNEAMKFALLTSRPKRESGCLTKGLEDLEPGCCEWCRNNIWQSMDFAPKDGTTILLWLYGRATFGSYIVPHGTNPEGWYANCHYGTCEPESWAPIPKWIKRENV